MPGGPAGACGKGVRWLLAQQVVNGVTIGSVYALVALGLTMVYGIMRVLDIANAAAYTLGAYLGLAAYLRTGNLLLALVAGIAGAAALGLLLQWSIYQPIAGSDPIVPLVAAIGLFTALGDLYRLIAGPYTRTFPVSFDFGPLRVGGVTVTATQLVIMAVAATLFAFLWYVLNHTRLGLSWRATSQDPETAAAMGINIRRVSAFAFVLGYAFAAVAGILIGIHYNQVYPAMGEMPSYKMLAIVVLGGLGNPLGAVIASLLIGMVETAVAGYLGSFFPSDAVAFLFLILVLLLRPQGLLGQRGGV